MIIPRLKNFTLIIFKYNIFEVVTSWLDTIRSLFLQNVDDVFPDFWTDGCYLLVHSFSQLGDSFGNNLVYSFLKVTPEIEVEEKKKQKQNLLRHKVK